MQGSLQISAISSALSSICLERILLPKSAISRILNMISAENGVIGPVHGLISKSCYSLEKVEVETIDYKY